MPKRDAIIGVEVTRETFWKIQELIDQQKLEEIVSNSDKVIDGKTGDIRYIRNHTTLLKNVGTVYIVHPLVMSHLKRNGLM